MLIDLVIHTYSTKNLMQQGVNRHIATLKLCSQIVYFYTFSPQKCFCYLPRNSIVYAIEKYYIRIMIYNNNMRPSLN
jgi:hypothetical protein